MQMMRKSGIYRAVEEACKYLPTGGLEVNHHAELEDPQIAEATSSAAMKVVLDRIAKRGDRTADFATDAYATVAIAYHRATGVYMMDKEMLELGTAAVHLLTMATSYIERRKNDGTT